MYNFLPYCDLVELLYSIETIMLKIVEKQVKFRASQQYAMINGITTNNGMVYNFLFIIYSVNIF